MRKAIAVGTFFVLGLATLAASGWAGQQKAKKPPLSPPASAECKLPGGKTIQTKYSSPRMRGRVIFAEKGLVPYGKVWRVGANEATTFVTTTDLTVQHKVIPAGSYTLFAIPEPSSWTLIISKRTGEWGIPYPGEQYELGRFKMQVAKLSSPLEDFTISYEPSSSGCTLNLEWATTRAFITFAEKK